MSVCTNPISTVTPSAGSGEFGLERARERREPGPRPRGAQPGELTTDAMEEMLTMRPPPFEHGQDMWASVIGTEADADDGAKIVDLLAT